MLSEFTHQMLELGDFVRSGVLASGAQEPLVPWETKCVPSLSQLTAGDLQSQVAHFQTT